MECILTLIDAGYQHFQSQCISLHSIVWHRYATHSDSSKVVNYSVILPFIFSSSIISFSLWTMLSYLVLKSSG